MRYIIVGKSNFQTFKNCYIPKSDDYFIGLDEGAFTILDNGFELKEAWGDFDDSNRLNELSDKNIILKKYNTDKNETDLELVLMNHKFDGEVLIYDVTGGRLDHEFVNYLLLRKYHYLNLKIIDQQNEIRYLSKTGIYKFYQDNYKYISLITLNKATISIIKAKYRLDRVHITINDTYTTSNEFEDNEFVLELLDGQIFVIRSI